MEIESYSIPWVSERPRYDKTTLLHYNLRDEKRGSFVCPEMEEGDLYSSVWKNMNGMSFNEGWQMIKKNHESRPYFRL